jgi:gentisate 1,2-dioxygenase
LNILGFYALMLRPGQTLQLPARSPASVFHVIEGWCRVAVQGQTFTLAEADTCCAPGYTAITLRNLQRRGARVCVHGRRIAAAQASWVCTK